MLTCAYLISPTVICLAYVRDTLLIYRDHTAFENLTPQMLDKGMLFEVESDIVRYIGVLVDRRNNGSIVMWQEGLSRRIVEAIFLDDKAVTSVQTPAKEGLHIDDE